MDAIAAMGWMRLCCWTGRTSDEENAQVSDLCTGRGGGERGLLGDNQGIFRVRIFEQSGRKRAKKGSSGRSCSMHDR